MTLVNRLSRYWSDRFRQAMVCSHDPKEWDSGQCYTAILGACLSGLTGHQLIIDLLLQDLRGHDNDLNNITLRARVLNDEQAARHLEESATAELALSNPFAWRNVLRRRQLAGQPRNGRGRRNWMWVWALWVAFWMAGTPSWRLGKWMNRAGSRRFGRAVGHGSYWGMRYFCAFGRTAF